MIEKIKEILANNWAIDEESRDEVARQINNLFEEQRTKNKVKLDKWVAYAESLEEIAHSRDAECEQEKARLFEEIEKHFFITIQDSLKDRYSIKVKDWQALKGREG